MKPNSATWVGWLLQVFPLSAGAAALTVAGARILGPRIPPASRWPLLLVLLLSYVGLLLSRSRPFLCVLSLAVLGLVVGAASSQWAPIPPEFPLRGAFLLGVSLLVIAAAIGRRVKPLRGAARRGLLVGLGSYLLIWPLLVLIDVGLTVLRLWAALGLSALLLLAATWGQGIDPRRTGDVPMLAADAYLLGLSLVAGLGILLTRA